MSAPDYRHRLALRVRWAEVDLQGVVFNGHYLAYCDVCLTEYWRAIGMVYPQAFAELGSDLYVRKATLEYHAPARYDDELDVCARSARLGNSSIVFDVAIFRRGEPASPLVNGELVYVNVDPASRTPAPLPAALRERIRAFERVAPVERR